jgi:uncharacterized protein (DUF1697 family)
MPPGSSISFVALLRGINVGGNRTVPMADLAEVFEGAGCRAVRTYIQSGNVVFESKGAPGALQSKLERAVAARFGFEVPVVVRAAAALEDCAKKNPFLGERGLDVGALHVAFLAADPGPARSARLDANRSPPDRFRVVGTEIYLHLPNGVARSKLTNAYFDSQLGTVATVRNWRTVLKLVDLARGTRA